MTRRIAIDAQSVWGQRTGIGNYTYHLVENLPKIDQKNQYFYIFNSFSKKLPQLSAFQYKNVTPIFTRIPNLWYNHTNRQQLYKWWFPFLLKQLNIELFHGTDFIGTYHNSFKTIITVHDLSFCHYPQFFPNYLNNLRSEMSPHLNQAHTIITDSDSTSRDIETFYPQVDKNTIKRIYLGIDDVFFKPVDEITIEKTKTKYKLPQQFFLFLGTLEPRKNLVGLISAYRQLPNNIKQTYPLVIAGKKGWLYEPIFEMIKKPDLNPHIHVLGYVANDDIPAILQAAILFVYPSFYEGFGLPVLEAMASGTPVITSNTSSLIEISADVAYLINPNNTDSIIEGIINLISNQEYYNYLKKSGPSHAKTFSWEKMVKEVINVYESV